MAKRSYKFILLLTLIFGTGFGANGVSATDPDVDFSVTVNPSLSLAVSAESVNLPITPDVDGEYNSAYFTITSATNNMYGYTLTMSTEDNHTYLESTTVDPVSGNKPQIQSLASSQDGISAATFEAATTEANGLNRWGIALNSGNYNAVTSPKQVKKTTTNNASGADTTTVNIAAKLNLAIPAGTYKNKFILQMVANPNVGTLEDAYQMAGKTKKTVGNESYYSMQDMNPGICAAAAQSNLQVVDERDNTIYHIGKLADNKCWLLDNLALDLTDTDVKNAMYDSSEQNHDTMTNATNEQLGYLFNGGRDINDSSTNNLPTAGLANWTTGYSYSAPLMNISNKSVEPTYDEMEEEDEPLADEVLVGHWKVGGYYNYCAASAGSYCYGNGTSDGSPSGNASSDICPSGWRMPTGGASGEYQALVKAITGGTSDWIDNPDDCADIRSALRLPLSGNFDEGSAYNQGSYGYFWSSTYLDSSSMYGLYLSTSGVSPQDYYNHYSGISIRCIAQ